MRRPHSAKWVGPGVAIKTKRNHAPSPMKPPHTRGRCTSGLALWRRRRARRAVVRAAWTASGVRLLALNRTAIRANAKGTARMMKYDCC